MILRNLLLIIGLLFGLSLNAQAELQEMSLDQLEARREAIDLELNQLANYSLRSGVGANGYRSKANKHAESHEWIEIELDQEIEIQEIILAPTLTRDEKSGYTADGFPLDFDIRAGKAGDTEGTIIASFTQKDNHLPRVAPLVVPIAGVKASWVRIEAKRLTARKIDGLFTLQFSEILIFSGLKNWALRQPVTALKDEGPTISSWHRRFLTDGSATYLMDASTGEQGLAYLSAIGDADQPSLTIDLGDIYSISQINLHAVDQSDTIPQSFPGDFGVPKHFLVEGATTNDFSDSVKLLEVRNESIYDFSPMMNWNVTESACRYVRLTALEPYIFNNGVLKGTRIGFAEIELIAQGQNVALGKPVSSNLVTDTPMRPIAKLTDGLNFYGDILPTRKWLEQLARRHDLELERPIITAELETRYSRQKTNLIRLSWLAGILGAGIAFTILIDRVIRLRQVARIKERFAADLHDELGANVHSIGMLSDVAIDADTADEWKSIHEKIWDLSQRTGTAIRYCTNMLEAKGLYIGLVEDMRRASKRITGNYTHEFTVEGEAHLKHLKPRCRVDLFLFYKESLINICRHSNATHLQTTLIVKANEVELTVMDNGKGTPEAPASLQRRARLMHAQMVTLTPEGGGTAVTITFKMRKLWPRFF